ncbi:MDR family MFS transporter [Lacticaseibacillus zhaodongensis]|uniref:MDR family MFS transporter n=1 Tax=Lacticaseibacillus zhaodongensis TaxID=2668065 RepID=UPI0012D2C23B|nr:MDR family MFS transporter [Lacticaseibacillus zhaodongensis]
MQNVRDIHGKKVNAIMLMITMIIGVFMTVLNQTILSTAFPTLMKAFNISAGTVQWLTTGFMLVNGVMIPVSAYLTAKIPTKWLYIGAMTTFGIGTLVAYVAGNFGTLLAGRLIQAVGVGITMPLLQNVMLGMFPPEKRGAAMGISGIAIGVAPAIGPTLSGWVLDNYSWRTLFGMLLPIIVVVLVLAFIFMKDILPNNNPKLDFWSLVESSIGFGALLYGFSEVSSKGWLDPVVLGSMAVGLIFIVIFGVRQLHLETPFLELRVFKSKIFTISSILSSIAMMAMVGVEMVLPMYLQIIHGRSALQSGLTLLPGAIMMAVMSPITGNVFDRIGAKRLAQLGMFLLTAGTVMLAFINATTPIMFITMIYAVRMFGISMVTMPLTTNAMNSLPTNLISHGTAVNNTLRQVASSMTTAIMVSVLSDVTSNNSPVKHLLKTDPLAYKHQFFSATMSGYQAAFWIGVGISFVGWILTFFLNSEKSSSKDIKNQAKVKEAA